MTQSRGRETQGFSLHGRLPNVDAKRRGRVAGSTGGDTAQTDILRSTLRWMVDATTSHP